MRLSARPSISDADVRAILHRHRLGERAIGPQPWVGGGSCVYPVGDDLVLKVPHDDPAPISSIFTEAIAVQAASAAGVSVPRLVVFDDSLDQLPVPYLLYERVRGKALLKTGLPPASAPHVWRNVGIDLALTHTGVHFNESLRRLPTHEQSADIDPRALLDRARDSGHMSPTQACFLGEVLDRLAPTMPESQPTCFCHGDVNAGNVMVGLDEPRAYVALIDWGGAGWGSPATDFSGISLRAIPFVIAGYREIVPEGDGAEETRILWSYLQLALFSLNRNQVNDPERTKRIERLLRDTRWFLRWAQST